MGFSKPPEVAWKVTPEQDPEEVSRLWSRTSLEGTAPDPSPTERRAEPEAAQLRAFEG